MPFRPNPKWQMPPHQQAPMRPTGPRTQPRPDPMDVDKSIQIRQVNYINRPHFDTGKRPPQLPSNDPNKRPRNFNIQTESEEQTETQTETYTTEANVTMTGYEQSMIEHEQQNDYEETLQEYTTSIEEKDAEYQYDYTYLNF